MTGEGLVVCTIISKNYLARARVLARSLARHVPEARTVVLLSDRIDGCFDPAAEPFTTVEIAALDIRDARRFCFQYSILELNTAVKPFFLEHLFARHGARKLVFLDPDILVLDSLAPLLELLDRHAIVLSPHLTDPIADRHRPGELDILRAGAYNLGFLALADRPPARALLEWWKRRLYTGCRHDPDRGFFVDQRWMDLVPGLFDDVAVLRDPGYNVAYWNLHGRVVTVRGDEVRVNGAPCRFFHFSGYDPDAPEQVSRFQDRFTMRDVGDAASLYSDYGRRLLASGHAEQRRWPYSWATYHDGTPIPPAARAAVLELDENAMIDDPFIPPPRPAASPATAAPRPVTGELPFGVNLAGCFQSEKCTGEGSRAVVRALRAAGIPFVLNNIVDPSAANVDGGDLLFSDENPYAVNLVHVNADQVPAFVAARPAGYFRRRRNVGFWNWELEELPTRWQESFAPFDEIWTPSTSTQRSIAGASPVPVRCVPYAVEIPGAPVTGGAAGVDRARFGLPDGQFLFLFAFDFLSVVERKNPAGVIRAFQRAFGKNPQVGLVLKSVHAAQAPRAWRELAEACAGWRNIHLIDRVVDRRSMHGLLGLCDAFVSLHRAEGFGLLMAEAMALGKPVVATACSSNLDFMRPENSLLVRWRPKVIEQDLGPYERGVRWADPDLDHAAELMRAAARDRAWAARLGERARRDIAEELSAQRIGALIRVRLAELEAAPREGSLAAFLWRVRRTADVMAAPGHSSRPILGKVVERLRGAALQLLRPTMMRQREHNEAVSAALAVLAGRVQRLERLERLEREAGRNESSAGDGVTEADQPDVA